ncbi:MAG: hypothetical protein LN415_08265 [Candidatus Thermoplasmatota archaeon]|nr:hypothetical protein [Candidatus Thermoplasmatota archaeon]
MQSKCPHCGAQVGQIATTCWSCGQSLEDVAYTRDVKATGPGRGALVVSGILLFVAAALNLLPILIFGPLGYYRLTLLDIAIPLALIGGILSILGISYKGTTACVLVAGILYALRALIPIFLIALVLVLIAAALISWRKGAFRF